MIATCDDLLSMHEEYKRDVSNTYKLTLARLAPSLANRDIRNTVDALSDWLKDMNQQYYRFRPARAATLTEDLEPLIREKLEEMLGFRARQIATLSPSDRRVVSDLFDAFKSKLGSTGAAKALHVLAPRFFPLWDNKIASAHGASTESGSGYFHFMLMRREDVRRMPTGLELPDDLSPLKLLDECDYLKYDLGRNH
jgi:hypothetical protein